MDRLEEQIDTYWGQRAHINWLQFGDRNTSFFHNACLERKRRNRIGKLKKEDRSWVEGEEEKKAFITNHFMQLFTAGIADVEAQKQQVLEAVEPRVTDAMNDHLTAEFSEDEIKRALDSIGDLKAPGPDGMPSIFFKKFWDVVGRKLTDEVMGVLHGGPMPEGWNETIISLIPKVDTPEKVTDLRPISLCNVVYKVVSKVLSSRLRDVLPDFISPFQSAFVPGRLISDNILVDYELTHFLLNKRGGEVGYAAIKLDMSKAYDRVEWHFLRDMTENGVLGAMDKSDHGLCDNSLIQNKSEWGFDREFCSRARPTARRSIITILISSLCGGLFGSSSAGGAGGAVGWSEGLSSST